MGAAVALNQNVTRIDLELTKSTVELALSKPVIELELRVGQRGATGSQGPKGDKGDPGTGISTIVAAETAAAGDLVVVNEDGEAALASADDPETWRLAAVVTTGGLTGATIEVTTICGQAVPIRFASAPPASANGEYVFLSTVPGVASLVPASAVGHAVVRVGILSGADGADTTPTVIFQPHVVCVL